MAFADHKEILRRARENFIEGDYTRSEELLQQVLLMDSHVPEVFHMLATIFYDRGQFNKAINYFKRALEIDPNYTDASVGLSIILNDLGRYEEGRAVFVEAQKKLDQEKTKEKTDFLEERLSAKHVELGDLYMNASIFSEALEQYQKALNLTATRPDLRVKIGLCYQKMGDSSRAIKEFKMALSEDPQSVQACIHLARLSEERQRPMEALDYWERALVLDPSNREAREALQRNNRKDLFSLT